MSESLERLYSKYPECVRCGFCCDTALCPYGKPRSEGPGCRFLEGDTPGFYSCGIHDKIVKIPGAKWCPAFGEGCCSSFNTEREVAIRNREHAMSEETAFKPWCHWHMGCTEFENGCGAHLHEGRFFQCAFTEDEIDSDMGKPTKNPGNWLGACVDYEPLREEDDANDATHDQS